jgi:hypothetical protein
VVAEDWAVYTCGGGLFGRLGLGDEKPRRQLTRVVKAAAFFYFFPCNHIINKKKNLFPAKQKTA